MSIFRVQVSETKKEKGCTGRTEESALREQGVWQLVLLPGSPHFCPEPGSSIFL
jgi:hypothetical protein